MEVISGRGLKRIVKGEKRLFTKGGILGQYSWG
jgi:hypothetical protein